MIKWFKFLSCSVVFSLAIYNSKAQVRFTQNKGQWQPNIQFKAELKSAKIFIGNGKLAYYFYDADKLSQIQHNNPKLDSFKAHIVQIEFLNANTNALYQGIEAYESYSNYFIGNKSQYWASNVPSYKKIMVKNIYNHIDFEMLEYQGQLKYNFIVNKGGNPSDIQLKYTGADSIYIQNDNMVFTTSLGTITELKPYVYEETKAKNTEIATSYTLNDNIVSFSLNSKRNKRNKLIIDPLLVFSTFSGSYTDNFGYTATYDDSGNAYSGGTVFNDFDNGFPSTTGAFQRFFAGGTDEGPFPRGIGYTARDCGILKYSKDGKKLLYATYLGGSTSNDQPHSMVVNHEGNLVIMGSTKSIDFPMANNGFDITQNGESDIFVAILSADGRQLKSSTYIGGNSFDGLNGDRPTGQITPLLYNYADDFRGEVIVDKNNNIYVASSTNSTDFPLSTNALDNSYNGKQEGCFFILDAACQNLLYSTYIGGTAEDAAYGLDFGLNNDIYITGGSTSSSFDYAVNGLKKTNNGGQADGFLARIDLPSGNILAYTMIGTSDYDQSYFVKTDKYGKPFIYGQTKGLMGVSANVYSNTNAKQFIKKINKECTAIELETVFGATNKLRPDISPTAFLIDQCERIFISGWGAAEIGGFLGGGTNGMPLTKDALQSTTDNNDFYVAVFAKNMRELLFSSYFGGRSSGRVEAHEHVDGGTSRFDKKGIIYQSLCGGCGAQSLYPTTIGAYSRTNNSGNCNNALFKIDFENLNRKPKAKDSFYTVFATDTLNFDLTVSDPDFDDTLSIKLEGEMFTNINFPKPLPKISSFTKSNTENKISAKITWRSGCQHISNDTIKLKVKVYDKGCPTQDSNQAIIKIVVKDPPLTLTPETICLNFKEDGSLKLSWESFPKNKYFKHIVLYRINPNARIIALDTIKNNLGGEYTDRVTLDPKANNYIYYMVGYNICNQAYSAGIRISTLAQYNTPIDSTYLNYATVIDNSKVKISWFTSKEDDFGSYDIYKADNINGVSKGYKKIKTIEVKTDTTYEDNNVKVGERSYCYKIGVNDKCGHISKPSNEACNIVLKGEAGPLFFDLDWMPYRIWHGGVKNYELSRRVDTGSLRYLTNTNLLRTYHDEALDLWWGAYFYVVNAYEGKNEKGEGYNAISQSNEIRLIQPPQVYVPNAFSPNDDATNDVWGVSHAFVREFDMKVFNRWGQKVWQNDFKGTQWDGKTNGKIAGNDVYIWIVTYRGWDNKFYTQKGTVTVMQ